MPQTVEISLRIPSLRVRKEETDTLETINNSDIRFSKQIEVDSIPKTGVVLTMGIATALIPLVVGVLSAFVAYGRWNLVPFGAPVRERERELARTS